MSGRDWRRMLALGLAGMVLAGCSVPRIPATQVVVRVDIDASIADRIGRVTAEVFSEDGQERVDEESYELTAGMPRGLRVSSPFSFAVARAGAEGFLIVVTGYSAADDGESAVIEQKAILRFEERKSLLFRVRLADVCLDNVCADTLQTCQSEGSAAGECGAVPNGILEPSSNGSELDGGSEAEIENGADASSELDADPPETTPDAGGDAGWEACTPGQYRSGEGAAQLCLGCVSGTFSTKEDADACSQWRSCPAGTYVANTPSDSEDRACIPCTGEMTTSGPNQSLCLPPESCPAGTVRTSEAGSGLPWTCRACSAGEYCAGGVVSAVACGGATWDHDGNAATSCAQRTNCVAGQHVITDGNATKDRTCKACDLGTFSTQSNIAECRLWSSCGTGYQERAPGTNLSDRRCVALPWTQQFGTAGRDYPEGVAVDEAGNVYVVGSTFGAFPGYTNAGTGEESTDVFLRKFDPVGAPLWTRQFGTDSYDHGHGVAVDSQGGVYVVGTVSGGLPGQFHQGVMDGFIRKYDANGSVVWTHQFGTWTDDHAYEVTVDRSGNVYMTGSAGDAFPAQIGTGGPDAYLRKYNTAGVELWTRQFGTNAGDSSNGVWVDADGDVYVAGDTSGAFPGFTPIGAAGSRDGFVRKYDPMGALLWTSQFGTSGSDSVTHVAVDASGNAYVVGMTGGAFLGYTAGGGLDAFIHSVDQAGVPRWTRQFGTPGLDSFTGVFPDSSGNVYVAGAVGGSFAGQSAFGDVDGLVARYDQSGVVGWARQLGTSGSDVAQGLAGHADGNLRVTGYTGGRLFGASSAGGDDTFVMNLVP
jgi:hypothetical protein